MILRRGTVVSLGEVNSNKKNLKFSDFGSGARLFGRICLFSPAKMGIILFLRIQKTEYRTQKAESCILTFVV